jgi:hypothetical protein
VSRRKMIRVPAFVLFQESYSSFAEGLEIAALEKHGAIVIDVPDLTNGDAVMVESTEMEWSPATFIGDSQDHNFAIVQHGSGHLQFVDWQKIKTHEERQSRLAEQSEQSEGGDA